MPTINKNKISHKELPYKHENNVSGKYYNTKQWKNLRNYYIRRNPLCEICLSKGIVKPANEVHHKRFILSGIDEDERYKLLTDESNLLSVCYECHDKLHAYAKKNNLNYAENYI